VESVSAIIAEPNRRAILSLLVSSQQSVGEIERQLRMTQPTVSKHLRVLREAGFVESTVDAQRRLYRSRSPDISYLSSATPLAAIALWFAVRSFYWAGSARTDGMRKGVWFEIAVGLVLAVALLTIQYKISQTYHADWTTTRDLANTAQQDVRDIRRDLVSQQEVQRRLDVLEQKIDALKAPKARPASAQGQR